MKNLLRALLVICFAALAMAPTAVERAFLKIDGIKGESTDVQHKDWLQAASFSWGAAPAGFTGPTCMATHTLNFTRHGRASLLGNLFSQHRVIPSMTVETNGERHLLQGVTLTSFDSKPAGGGNVTESLSLNFTKCETHYQQQSSLATDKRWLTPDLKLKLDSPNAILIGLTPKPESAALIGLLFNGDGHGARLTRKAGGSQDAFRQAFQSKQVIPTLTLTLNNGQKWTFTNLTVAGITDGTSRGTESLSLNFTRVEGPAGGFQDLSYKE